MTKCSIIIAAYNEAENLKNCLTSLYTSNFTAGTTEIIVVDNNSTDDTPEIISLFTQVIFLKEEKQGASFARNKGIAHSSGDIVVFLDADTTVTENWLTYLTAPFEDPSTGAVGGGIHPADQKNPISEYLGVSLFMRYPRYGKKRKIKGFPSCNLAVRKNLLGVGFDTGTFTTYGEDKDICLSVIKKGSNVIFEPLAVIRHKHPLSLSELFTLLVKSSRGRSDFGKKHAYAPDIVILNFHIPGVYLLFIVLSPLFGGSKFFLAFLSPALLYFACSSILSFIRSKKFILCFFIKPLLDVLSLYTIYASYTFFKNKKVY